jgi:hypothetical protein
MGWGYNSNGVPVILGENAQHTGAMANQVGAGVLMIKPPPGR